MGHREELIARSIPFLSEVKDMTPGAEMERWLNRKYGEDSPLYKDLARLIKLGVEEGWAANIEITGPHYRRSKIAEPSAETFHFSITAVYMNSKDVRTFARQRNGAKDQKLTWLSSRFCTGASRSCSSIFEPKQPRTRTAFS
jgi:hypothetical protein